MKRNKFICLIMAIAMSALLCGCDKRDLPDDIENQLSTALFINADGFISCARVKGKYKEFAESCFDDIEIYGAKFALPMNVSDLPEGFTVDEGQSPKSYYNGYKTANVKLYFEGVTAASAEIMYPANSSQSEGQIVTLSFTEYLLNTEAPFRMGGEFGYLSMNRAAELLGECEKREYMIYALGNDRTIRFDYFNTDENSSDCNAFSVTLTTADMGVN